MTYLIYAYRKNNNSSGSGLDTVDIVMHIPLLIIWAIYYNFLWKKVLNWEELPYLTKYIYAYYDFLFNTLILGVWNIFSWGIHQCFELTSFDNLNTALGIIALLTSLGIVASSESFLNKFLDDASFPIYFISIPIIVPFLLHCVISFSFWLVL